MTKCLNLHCVGCGDIGEINWINISLITCRSFSFLVLEKCQEKFFFLCDEYFSAFQWWRNRRKVEGFLTWFSSIFSNFPSSVTQSFPRICSFVLQQIFQELSPENPQQKKSSIIKSILNTQQNDNQKKCLKINHETLIIRFQFKEIIIHSNDMYFLHPCLNYIPDKFKKSFSFFFCLSMLQKSIIFIHFVSLGSIWWCMKSKKG